MAELLRYDTKSLDRWKQCECCGDYSFRDNICDDCCDEIDQEEWYMQHIGKDEFIPTSYGDAKTNARKGGPLKEIWKKNW